MTKKLYSITLKSDTQELHDSVMQLMLSAKPQLVSNLTSLLNSKGVASDLTMQVANETINFSSKTVDKGFVVVVENGVPAITKYSEVAYQDIYFVISDGHFKLYLKHTDGIDRHIAGFGSIEEVVNGASSDDVKTAVRNLLEPKTLEEASVVTDEGPDEGPAEVPDKDADAEPQMTVTKGAANVE